MSHLVSTRADYRVDSNATSCLQFKIGGVSVRFNGARLKEGSLDPVLKLFCVEAGVADIDVRVDSVASLVNNVTSPLFDSGTTWRLYKTEGGLQFDFSSPAFGARPYKRLVVDRSFRRALLQMNEESFAGFPSAASPLEYPLDELLIMHRLTQEKAIELHGCGIVRADGSGNLFVGHSGAGKSTTTRLWRAREDVEVLSDDRIIVRQDPLKQIPRFARNDKENGSDKRSYKMRMYGTPWHGEAIYASPGSAALVRIFILEHGHGNVLTRLSHSQAVAELFARSFVPFHRHEYIDSALMFLQEVVDAVPVYRYSFEPDQHAVDTILNLQ
jgi:hypothetical protein